MKRRQLMMLPGAAFVMPQGSAQTQQARRPSLTEAAEGMPAREWVSKEFQDQTHVDFYNDLAAALTAGRTPPVTGEDGRAALEIVLAIYRSADTAQPVTLPL